MTPEGNSPAAAAIAWCDLNRDGLWEVFVGDAAGTDSRLYKQTNGNTFVLSESLDLPGVVAAQSFDADHDGNFDLLVTRAVGGPRLYYGRDGSWGGGSIDDDAPVDVQFFDASSATSAVAADVDADTWPDIIASSLGASEAILNLGGWNNFSEPFANLTAHLELAGLPAATLGMVLADYNLDGDIDLFLGRESDLGQVLSDHAAKWTRWASYNLVGRSNGNAKRKRRGDRPGGWGHRPGLPRWKPDRHAIRRRRQRQSRPATTADPVAIPGEGLSATVRVEWPRRDGYTEQIVSDFPQTIMVPEPEGARVIAPASIRLSSCSNRRPGSSNGSSGGRLTPGVRPLWTRSS